MLSSRNTEHTVHPHALHCQHQSPFVHPPTHGWAHMGPRAMRRVPDLAPNTNLGQVQQDANIPNSRGHSTCPRRSTRGRIISGVFFWLAKIGGGGDLVLLLRNEGKFWYKAPCCCILVDGCAVRHMWKPLAAEKHFHPASSMRRKRGFWNENWLVERPQCWVVRHQKIGGPWFNPHCGRFYDPHPESKTGFWKWRWGVGGITWSHQFSLRRFFFHLHGETVYLTSALIPPLDHCPSAHDSPSAVNIGGLEGLQRTQCQLTPRLIYVAPSHCMQRAENPSCSPCLVYTF